MHAPAHAPDSGSLPKSDLELLREMAAGAWDMNSRMEESGVLAPVASLFNQILENLGEALTQSALCGIDLYANAPRLYHLAQKLEGAAEVRAGHAASLVKSVERMAADLKCLAGNAGRAAAFAEEADQVISELQAGMPKIESLARSSDRETAKIGKEIADRLRRLEGAVRLFVTTATGNPEAPATLSVAMDGILKQTRQQEKRSEEVFHDVEQVSEEARQQSEDSVKLRALAARIEEGSDQLVVCLGVFRLPAHLKPRELIRRLARHPLLRKMERGRQETILSDIAAHYTFIELLYITDAKGTQVTRNIAAREFTASYGSSGLNCDWSRRPWYTEVARTGELFTSDIYRSAATDRFCFTVSAPLYDEQGMLVGILAADIDLCKLL